MTWIDKNSPVFVEEDFDNEDELEEEEYVQIRVRINKKLWSKFKGAVTLDGNNIRKELNKAIMLYVSEDDKHDDKNL